MPPVMQWRRRLREVRGLFGLPIDQADAYMRRGSPRPRRGAPPIAPLVARKQDATALPPPPQDPPPPFRPSRLRKYRPLLLRKAEALLERGEIIVETNGGEPLRARILRFHDGTAVFEYDYRSAHGSGRGMTRLEPDDVDPEVLVVYLDTAFLNARVRPVAGQEI